MMRLYGAFRRRRDRLYQEAGRYLRIRQAKREAEKEKQEPVDLIESSKLTLRKNPLTAWPIMIVLAFGFIITCLNQGFGLVNQVVAFLKSLNLMK